LRRAPLLMLERRRAALDQAAGRLRALAPHATLERGYAIVRAAGKIVRAGSEVSTGTQVDVELGTGGFGARIEETR
jgi:exodeoxyribonuclease VII large subunit